MQIGMEWKSLSFDWNRVRAFLVTAEEGSLSAAARALGLTQPTLGRQVSALEAELGVTLFERVAQGLALTESGVELLDAARSMGDAASELALRASGQSQQVEGTVTISASELDATVLLPPILAELKTVEPGIFVEVVVSNSPSDLKRREADIALRYFRPSEPDLIARKLRDNDVWLYATEAVCESLNGAGSPESVDNLPLIAYERTVSNLQLLQKKGFPVTLDNIVTASQSYLVQLNLIKQGLGVGMLMSSLGDHHSDIKRCFSSFGPLTTVPLWLVCHRELHTSLRVRRVFDALVQALAQ